MTTEKKLNSVFHQMYRGERKNEGSFTTGLYELFFKADQGNKRKLVEAFPDFFGEEVPEFGISVIPQPTKVRESDTKMNIHLHLRDTNLHGLEGSLKYSEEMISELSPLISEMLQKHQGSTQSDSSNQLDAFHLRLKFRKFDIVASACPSRRAFCDGDSVYDRM